MDHWLEKLEPNQNEDKKLLMQISIGTIILFLLVDEEMCWWHQKQANWYVNIQFFFNQVLCWPLLTGVCVSVLLCARVCVALIRFYHICCCQNTNDNFGFWASNRVLIISFVRMFGVFLIIFHSWRSQHSRIFWVELAWDIWKRISFFSGENTSCMPS